jgi:hypothetical protein
MMILKKIWEKIAGKFTAMLIIIILFFAGYSLYQMREIRKLQERNIKLQVDYGERMMDRIEEEISAKLDSVRVIEKTIIEYRKEEVLKKDEIENVHDIDSLIALYYKHYPRSDR